MVSSGQKSDADAARLFKVHPETVSRLMSRASSVGMKVPAAQYKPSNSVRSPRNGRSVSRKAEGRLAKPRGADGLLRSAERSNDRSSGRSR
jgi:hypothetical protein